MRDFAIPISNDRLDFWYIVIYMYIFIYCLEYNLNAYKQKVYI